MAPPQPTPHLSTLKGWKAESAWLADLQQTVYPHKWSPVSCRSSAWQGKFADQRPTFYHCTTQPTVELHLLANVGVGCPMGELLTQLVPRGAYVRIPIANDTRRSTQCYRVCKCGGHNLLHHCRDMGCIRADQCQLNYGMIQGRPSL